MDKTRDCIVNHAKTRLLYVLHDDRSKKYVVWNKSRKTKMFWSDRYQLEFENVTRASESFEESRIIVT